MPKLKSDLNEIKRQKDTYLTPANLKAGVTVLGVNGELAPGKAEQEKIATPSQQLQDIVPDQGYALSKVRILPVTNTVDSNIRPENIKNNVTILGVTGTLPGQDYHNVGDTRIVQATEDITEGERIVAKWTGLGNIEMIVTPAEWLSVAMYEDGTAFGFASESIAAGETGLAQILFYSPGHSPQPSFDD